MATVARLPAVARSIAAVIGILCSVSSILAFQSATVEYEVKAAFLYNFSKFVKWREEFTAGKEAFEICVLGRDPFGPALDTILTGEKTNRKDVVAKRISKIQKGESCNILFISLSEEGHLKEILATLGKPGMLTVSDIPQFTQLGGMIQFVWEGKRVRFEVNLAAAETSGLTLSSELLKVAVNVRRTSGDR